MVQVTKAAAAEALVAPIGTESKEEEAVKAAAAKVREAEAKTEASVEGEAPAAGGAPEAGSESAQQAPAVPAPLWAASCALHDSFLSQLALQAMLLAKEALCNAWALAGGAAAAGSEGLEPGLGAGTAPEPCLGQAAGRRRRRWL
jgi:hypothetical protein